MLYFFSGIGGAIYASIWWAYSYWKFQLLAISGVIFGFLIMCAIVLIIVDEIEKNA